MPTATKRPQKTSRGIAQVPLTGDSRGSVRAFNNARTLRFRITIKATVQITTLATSIRNGGMASALVDLFVHENGKDRVKIDGRAASHLTACYAAGQPTNVRATSMAVNTYNLVERVTLHFSPRQAVVPSETSFTEYSSNAPLFVEALARGASGAALYARLFGGGAGTVSALSIEVEQEFYPEGAAPLPLYIPVIREQIEAAPGANDAQQVFLRSTERLRGVLVMQDSDVGIVSDIIQAAALRGDNTEVIGPNAVTWDNLAQEQEDEFPGSVYPLADAAMKTGMVFFNFQQEGRLTRTILPNRDHVNLRFEFKTGASAAANPKIRLVYIELERPQPSSGRILVNPGLPAALA